MADFSIQSPVIFHPTERVNYLLKGDKVYPYGTIIGKADASTAPNDVACDVYDGTNVVPVGIVTDFEGIDLTGKADTVVVLGAGRTELDYVEAVKLNPYLATSTSNGLNAKLNGALTDIRITRRKEL